MHYAKSLWEEKRTQVGARLGSNWIKDIKAGKEGGGPELLDHSKILVSSMENAPTGTRKLGGRPHCRV